mmetsp:Transcript_17214/g.31774  ORF Transcript_17214/g.31774 Transcript_17214/m.31774 type:complete len:123 (+) Transcript_17214:94-462(+)
MPASDHLFKDFKDNGCPCFACFCFDDSCVTPGDPLCLGQGKLFCCQFTLSTNCPPIACSGAACYSEEQGCVESKVKVCCAYTENQCPPSMDIGFGCCGMRCIGGNAPASAKEESYAPLQETM